MRRYLPLLFISFLFVVAAVTGTFIAGQAGRQKPDNVKTIIVYTSLPTEQAAVLAQEYEKVAGIRVNIVPLSAHDLLARMRLEAAAPRADLVLAGTDTLAAAKAAKLLSPHTSEQTDIIPEAFTEKDNFWVGLWYDPVIFAANKDYLKQISKAPTTWADLAAPDQARLVLTDFLAADAAANLLYTMAAGEGEEKTLKLMDKLHPKVVQYAKFLATPSRMTGLGEADIAVTVMSEALRYVKDGFPIHPIIPADGTACFVTGVALASGAPQTAEAAKFADWLTTDQAHVALFKNKFFLIPTNPESVLIKEYNAKAVKLIEYEKPLTPEQKAKLLDKWMQTVRLRPR